MNKLSLLLVITCIAATSSAGQIPSGLSDLLARYTEDSTIAYGFQESKSTYGIDKSISFKDISVGTPIELFFIDYKKLELIPETEAVEKFIKPLKRWEAPVRAGDSTIYRLLVCDRGQYWELCGSSSCYPCSDAYDEFRKKWPENDFVIIEYGNYSMFHFPKLNKHNLLFPHGDLGSIKFPADIKNPSDSRDVIAGLKKDHQAKKEYWKKNPTFAPPAAFEELNEKGDKNANQ